MGHSADLCTYIEMKGADDLVLPRVGVQVGYFSILSPKDENSMSDRLRR